jgi:hypothetical protein
LKWRPWFEFEQQSHQPSFFSLFGSLRQWATSNSNKLFETTQTTDPFFVWTSGISFLIWRHSSLPILARFSPINSLGPKKSQNAQSGLNSWEYYNTMITMMISYDIKWYGENIILWLAP